jgi:hypothetical protein
MKLLAAATAMTAVGVVGGAHAATITKTYEFTLSGFVDPYGGATAPTSAVTASFTLTFDPTVQYNDDSADLTVNALNVPVDSTVGFSTYPGASPGDPYFISIGGLECGVGDVCGGTNDFVLQLKFANESSFGSPTLPLCSDPGYICGPAPANTYASGYTSSSYPNSLFVATVATAAVPEPATWGLMLVGFGGLGALSRRRRSIERSAAAGV